MNPFEPSDTSSSKRSPDWETSGIPGISPADVPPESDVLFMKPFSNLIPWLSLVFAILALFAIPFGPVFYPIFGDFSGLVQVYGGFGFRIVAAVLGIAGVVTFRKRPIGLTIMSGLSSLTGFAVIALIAVAYAMEWLSPAFY